ncbi:hypothetical protein ZIOFF_037833 [Zingiber officinale]|uniref:Uncharacterized protein n=1 Tax=Zingiber officinale TaxID=94328 RepID=A0A8J5GKZ1_ZINOF|nr:hypothetical protein ZIOFF_037833 [Zingiber officinale]
MRGCQRPVRYGSGGPWLPAARKGQIRRLAYTNGQQGPDSAVPRGCQQRARLGSGGSQLACKGSLDKEAPQLSSKLKQNLRVRVDGKRAARRFINWLCSCRNFWSRNRVAICGVDATAAWGMAKNEVSQMEAELNSGEKPGLGGFALEGVGYPSDCPLELSSESRLEHCNTAPVQGNNSSSRLYKTPDFTLSRSKTEKKVTKYDLKLDSLPESEKKKLIENLVKIQNDGTVKVDVQCTTPVASQLLELAAVGSTPVDINESSFDLGKSIPRLNIAILVVGTRGDVQPFIAFAKKLQANMARNKGLLAAPTEINVQRKQLKEIIDSLLPACTEPDLISGMPFLAQAIIANPPAYGNVILCKQLEGEILLDHA